MTKINWDKVLELCEGSLDTPNYNEELVGFIKAMQAFAEKLEKTDPERVERARKQTQKWINSRLAYRDRSYEENN